MIKYKKTTLFLTGLLMIGISVLAWATVRHYQPPVSVKKVVAIDSGFRKHVYDKAMLDRFTVICKKYQAMQQEYTVAGSINLLDKADTSIRMRDVSFAYCKKGNSFYYRMGKNELVNAYGQYVSIDNEARSIVFTQQMKVEEPEASKMLSNVEGALRSEAYNLVSARSGALETLSLINEFHISCKQYSVSFDTLDLKINRIYGRFSNIYDPLRKDKEKICEMKFQKWEATADISAYEPQKIVEQSASGTWKPTEKYAGYRIIKM